MLRVPAVACVANATWFVSFSTNSVGIGASGTIFNLDLNQSNTLKYDGPTSISV